MLPQTQGARFLYETHVHPFLEQNEGQIEAFIADAHERLKATGISYLKQAIEAIKVNVLGLPPSEPEPEHPPASAASQSYTQSLLARFSVPGARWTAGTNPASNAGADFYSLLAGAVSAATSAASASGSSARDPSAGGGLSSLIPSNLTGAGEKMSFIAAQRERLNVVLGALDREAAALQREESLRSQNADSYPRAASWTLDGGAGSRLSADEEPTQRPSSRRPSSGGFGFGDWNRNRSESEFEKIDAESGAEDEDKGGARRRAPPGGGAAGAPPGGSWMPWGWGGATPTEHDRGVSSGRDLDR